MAGKKKNTEVVSLQKYKRKGHLNIGTILFGIIFVYLVFTVLIYFTKDRVSVYEVREGSILKDRNLTGMVLRKETVVNAEKSGYVNYFVDDAQKVALGTNIYTITSSKLETQTDQDSNEEVSLNADEWNSILLKAQGFNESYSPEEFKTASNLKSEVTAILQNNTTQRDSPRIVISCPSSFTIRISTVFGCTSVSTLFGMKEYSIPLSVAIWKESRMRTSSVANPIIPPRRARSVP